MIVLFAVPIGPKLSKPELDCLHSYRCFPRWPLVIAAVLVVSGVLAATVHWGFWILTLLTLGFVFSLAYGIADHYCNGCANPARVVSLDPDLIAVHADLTTGGRPAHVIKVLPQPLRRLRGEQLAVGNRLATVAFVRLSSEARAVRGGRGLPAPGGPPPGAARRRCRGAPGSVAGRPV